jgi:hypothetical protein
LADGRYAACLCCDDDAHMIPLSSPVDVFGAQPRGVVPDTVTCNAWSKRVSPNT